MKLFMHTTIQSILKLAHPIQSILNVANALKCLQTESELYIQVNYTTCKVVTSSKLYIHSVYSRGYYYMYSLQ